MYLLVSYQYLHVSACIMSESVKLCMHMHGRKEACYPLGMCNRQGAPGLGSPLFYINSWAMIWPVDYKKGGF